MRDKVFIVFGVSSINKQKQVLASHSPAAARRALARVRDMSTAHWAYLEIGGRRIDDDRIAERLGGPSR